MFHETFHGLRRGAHEAGTITPAMEISLLMNHDKSLGDRRVRDSQGKQTGADLRFIPAGITAEMMATGEIPAAMIPAALQGDGKRYAETLLDEGISEMAEVEVLKLRKGQGKGKLGITRELVSRNLASLAKLQPGVAGSWKAFFSAVRAHWGLATSRAIVLMRAEKNGEFDPAEREVYLNKLLGLDAQEEHETGVKDEFSRLMAGFDDVEADDIPFSIGFDNLTKLPAGYEYESAEKISERVGEIAGRHGLTILELPADLSSRIADFKRASGVQVVFYRWQGRKVASSNVNERTAAFISPSLPGSIFLNSEAPYPLEQGRSATRELSRLDSLAQDKRLAKLWATNPGLARSFTAKRETSQLTQNERDLKALPKETREATARKVLAALPPEARAVREARFKSLDILAK